MLKGGTSGTKGCVLRKGFLSRGFVASGFDDNGSLPGYCDKPSTMWSESRGEDLGYVSGTHEAVLSIRRNAFYCLFTYTRQVQFVSNLEARKRFDPIS